MARILGSTLLVAYMLLLSSCGEGKASRLCGSNMPQPGLIQDLITYPQDLFIYADVLPSKPILSEFRAKKFYDESRRDFFSVWTTNVSKVSVEDAYEVFLEKKDLGKTFDPGRWAENLLPWTRENWDALLINADEKTFPSRFDKAIVVERFVMRRAPTNSPTFRDPKLAGEGFPFDGLSLSNIHMGTPVRVLHTSKDGAWVYIETGSVAGFRDGNPIILSGWAPEGRVALVSSELVDKILKSSQVAITRDNTSFRYNNRFIGLGFLGAVLPLAEEKDESFIVLVPIRDENGMAKTRRAEVSKSDATPMPAVLTAQKMASIANPLINQPYGWGGEFGRRDCSEFVRDLFIPFGVWLPRNSSGQITAWNFIPVEDSAESSVNALLKEKGVPFATLIGFKGHIGLYLGMRDNTPVMLHDLWGLRIEKDGVEGRHILGRVVVTSLEPGVEITSIKRSGLLKKILGISTLRHKKLLK